MNRDISFLITFQLFSPKSYSRGWRGNSLSTGVPVPKAAVDEDDFAPCGEDKVRTSGQRTNMQAVAIPKGMHQSPHE
jgi:hypothetical protein